MRSSAVKYLVTKRIENIVDAGERVRVATSVFWQEFARFSPAANSIGSLNMLRARKGTTPCWSGLTTTRAKLNPCLKSVVPTNLKAPGYEAGGETRTWFYYGLR